MKARLREEVSENSNHVRPTSRGPPLPAASCRFLLPAARSPQAALQQPTPVAAPVRTF